MRVREALLKIEDTLDTSVICVAPSGYRDYFDSVQDLLNARSNYIKDNACVSAFLQTDIFGNQVLFVYYDVKEV